MGTEVSAKSSGRGTPAGRRIKTKRRLVFMANNLPQLPQSKVYELWLIPMSGASPMPAGTFMPDEKGGAIMMDHAMPAGTEAKAFAVTVENAPGSEKPTMPMVLMGAGE